MTWLFSFDEEDLTFDANNADSAEYCFGGRRTTLPKLRKGFQPYLENKIKTIIINIGPENINAIIVS